ncbi:uncharacterized protein TNCV_4175491 [Trichonephila clavipes]|nr:uncharacterized protein TNCV_4175491 [Trichonephila clavipes]
MVTLSEWVSIGIEFGCRGDPRARFKIGRLTLFLLVEIVSKIDEHLTCTKHEEADTKIIHHICNIDVRANFVVRCSDTDIAANMLGNMRHLKNDEYHEWVLTDMGNKTGKYNGWTLEDNQHFNWFDGDQLPAFVSESFQDELEEYTKDVDEDNEDVQYHHWIDDEILNFNDGDNED